MSEEALQLLRQMNATLIRIEAAIVERTVKRKSSSRSRLSKLAAEAQETLADQTIPKRVVELWGEICPDCPQPLTGLDACRRQMCRELWQDMQGEQGVRSLFLTVAANDWLSGRVINVPGRRRAQRSAGVGLWETIANKRDIIEGTYR